MAAHTTDFYDNRIEFHFTIPRKELHPPYEKAPWRINKMFLRELKKLVDQEFEKATIDCALNDQRYNNKPYSEDAEW